MGFLLLRVYELYVSSYKNAQVLMQPKPIKCGMCFFFFSAVLCLSELDNYLLKSIVRSQVNPKSSEARRCIEELHICGLSCCYGYMLLLR